ncbi:5-(carboxyamino)imidazole ribonucleotide synthase [Clostridium sp. SYSU_GA19001]|uniref:5-(carboxyamino)imidazole ribonucleotide synthase n=1 Tax=Clostridium caldaquaticum TaxID=2940653 RepID=UPI0020773DC5|nr:5-(carboxyamino)imidazole ribonucleotide synthase [Clostridium caldaquaticum]MCM8712107.1 5-(carboxyamino)imidazole ribonucleotide synthase [Clostridium caldaquaticum]
MLKENFISKKVGIIGGGQLGKMILNEAKKMSIYTVVLDPSKDCPASSLTNELIVAGFDDKRALEELAERVDVITYEFEHISIEALKTLEAKGYVIYPSVKSLEIIQNKYNQKMKLKKEDIPLGDFIKVESIEDIKKSAENFGYPIMLKCALGAYDGKGNSLIKCEEEIVKAFKELGCGSLPLYVEKYVPFIKEISVLCCRGDNGETVVYPVAENKHKNSILFETSVPAEISFEEKEKAMEIAKKVCEIFEGVGMFCIEMFLTDKGEVLVNEIAPRPHNSGHYTIEGCITSQFENHLRAVMGLPLGSTELLRPTVMRNLLGEEGFSGEAKAVGIYEALKIPEVSIHIYGKKYTASQRKMGHITVTAPSVKEAREKAERAHSLVKIISK